MDALRQTWHLLLPSHLAAAMGLNGATADMASAPGWANMNRVWSRQGSTAPSSTSFSLRSMYFTSEQDLPPLLAPVPSLCRLLALLVVLPFVIVCMVDFAGYAIFRTLGFQRRRVRVKRSSMSSSSLRQSAGAFDAGQKGAGNTGNISPALVRAPVLQPGSYDADTLLRHRARSISGESAEAEEEWSRTGGTFARVSHVRARQEAAAASAAATSSSSLHSLPAGEQASTPASYAHAAAKKVSIPSSASTGTSARPRTNTTSSSSSGTTMSHDRYNSIGSLPSLSPPESPRQAFAGASNIGVEGALGYFDTDAEEESGTETSGMESPEEQRSQRRLSAGSASRRRGLSSSALGFTPVSPSARSGSATSSDGISPADASKSQSEDSTKHSTNGTINVGSGLGIRSSEPQ